MQYITDLERSIKWERDSIREYIEATQQEVDKYTGEGRLGEKFAQHANGIARAEGRLFVLDGIAVVMGDISRDTAASIKYAKQVTIDAALRGSDDTWSGRGNDNRRAFYEGVVEAVRVGLDYLDRLDEKIGAAK